MGRIRAVHKEQKRKEKEAARRKKEDEEDEEDVSEAESVDLSWLPDPDKVYDAAKNDQDDENSSDNENSGESEDEQTEVKVGKRKITVIKKVVPKKPRVDDDDNVLDTGLSMVDDEDLALQLLAK